ncbi:histidine--tRNA ligase [Bradyrhizobium mercantei]|uniref:histidine--tRNA ligase n=1 Tax=Bradyrhizobium mercantei TaxID=1904807 RepID=UPI0009784430|nr:histidine--tRNA ligase [Bradyrhizobium mercantei]
MNPTRKMEAQVPRGFSDVEASDIRAIESMKAKLASTYELYGFDPVENPCVEFSSALGKFLPDQDRPNEGVFSFKDDDNNWLSLRYDLTAPLARYVAENFDKLPKPFRSYRSGWVFRNEKPGPGRFRQFMQFDADTVGASGVSADAEMCMMAADAMETLGIDRKEFVVKVSNRKLLDGILDMVGLADPADAARRLIVLRAIDKTDRLGLEGVRALLGKGRQDESGDFTRGAELHESGIERVLAMLSAGRLDSTATIGALREVVGNSPNGNEGVDELCEIGELVEAAGYSDRVRLDPSVVRGLEYYTGPVYEIELTFQTSGEPGEPSRFGSVGGGGRYDGLVGRFQDQPVPATGFSIGISRLLAAVRHRKLLSTTDLGPVVVLAMDRDRTADYQRMVSDLRSAGVRSEMYVADAGLKAQMRYADKRNSPCVVIQGSNEHRRGTVVVKDLIAGKKLSSVIGNNQEWRGSREAQSEVRVGELVAEVTGIISRHR